MWRPKEGWNNPYPDHPKPDEPMSEGQSRALSTINYERLICRTAFEAGADAILEALKRAGKHIYTGGYAVNWEGERIIPAGASGFIIFIPDFDPS